MNSFSSNCTLPPDGKKFVSSPQVRGTLDIAWSCLSVLVICTWSVLHLNVPVPSERKTTWHKFNRFALRTIEKLRWMLFNLLAPEFSLATAWADSRAVDYVKAAFHKAAEMDGVPWEKCHSHFANLGGFVISFADTPTLPSEGSHRSRDTMPRRDANGVSLCNDELHLPGLDHADPGIQLGEIDRHQDESDQDQNMRRLASQPNHNQDSDIHSLLETGEFVPGVASTTGVVAQPGAFHDNSLPVEFRKELDKLRRQALLNSFPRYHQKLSRAIGTLEFKPHLPNTISAMESLRGVRMDHFHTPWEESRFCNMPGAWVENVLALQGDRWVVDANQLLYARDMGIIEKLPSLSSDIIEDRSKEDILAKCIALGQIGWFLIQTITRLSLGLATSPLEIMTLAFAVSTGFTYFLLLDKPKDAGTSVIIPAARYASPQEMARIAVAGPRCTRHIASGIWIPNEAVHATSSERWNKHVFLGASFSVFILGAIHCLGWNFKYPTDIEHLLWQASSIITAAVFPVFLAFSLLEHLIVKLFEKCRLAMPTSRLSQMCYYLFWVVGFTLLNGTFFAARLFVLFEVVRSLAFLPAETFKTTWSDNIPHIG